MKILVIEDDEPLQYSFRMLFDELSLKDGQDNPEIIFAENLESAINEMKKNKFEVISSDGTFPDYERGPNNRTAGITLLRKLNDLSHAGHTIFYSGNPDQVREASEIRVADRPVFSYEKMGVTGLNGLEWAELCIGLARDSHIRLT